MRDRLIELIDVARNDYYDFSDDMHEKGLPVGESSEEYIADHLLANGVILPPCKVGDEVYYIVDGQIQALRVNCVTFDESGLTIGAECKDKADLCECACWWDGKTCGIGFDYSHIGKTVFLTREEAEAKLKGGEE